MTTETSAIRPLSDAHTSGDGGTILPHGHQSIANQKFHAVGGTRGGDQSSSDAHSGSVPSPDTSGNQVITDTQGRSVPGTILPAEQQAATDMGSPEEARGAVQQAPPIVGAPLAPYLFTPELCLLAQQLDDLEGLRKAEENRHRALTRTDEDRDGVQRGYMLDPEHPAAKAVRTVLDGLRQLEHQTELALKREMRANPLNEWRKSQPGIGEKTLARLLNCVGDPYVRMDDGRPRTVSQLWAYCGLHTIPADTSGSQARNDTQCGHAPGADMAARRRKGMVANWSTQAKTRAYLIAECCVKAGVRKDADGNRYAKDGSEYAQLYIDRREHTAITHPEWTPAHSQSDALRIVSKRILRNLWRAARDIHMNDETKEEQ